MNNGYCIFYVSSQPLAYFSQSKLDVDVSLEAKPAY